MSDALERIGEKLMNAAMDFRRASSMSIANQNPLGRHKCPLFRFKLEAGMTPEDAERVLDAILAVPNVRFEHLGVTELSPPEVREIDRFVEAVDTVTEAAKRVEEVSAAYKHLKITQERCDSLLDIARTARHIVSQWQEGDREEDFGYFAVDLLTKALQKAGEL